MNEHTDFRTEQNQLSKTWLEVKNIHEELLHLKATKEVKRKDAKEKDKEGYGSLQILNRDIRELGDRISYLNEALNALYFGKIQFHESGELHVLYIGKKHVSCASLDVISWHSPIADVFFSREGLYDCPEKNNKVIDLRLVRRLDVEKNVLRKLEDLLIEEKMDALAKPEQSDRFLIEQLERSGDARLRDVVMTIQKEQNKIIRTSTDKHIIIQGSAGTGKTIVLVYRIAYLIHNQKLNIDDVLYVSPSQIFRGYLNSILPDADIGGLPSITLPELFPTLAKTLFKSISDFPGVLEVNPGERDVASDAASFKATYAFKKLIDKKLEQVATDSVKSIPGFHYRYEGEQQSIPAREIRTWFMDDFRDLSLETRVKMIRDRIKGRLENLVGSPIIPRRSSRAFTHQETESMLAGYFKSWTDYNKVFTQEVVPWYINLLRSAGEIGMTLDSAHTKISEGVSIWNRYFAKFTINDWAAIFYMQQKLIGKEGKKYKLIAIDESQILSPLWLTGLMSMLTKDGKFLLAGDMNQKPAVIDQDDWYEHEKTLENVEVMELKNCYRLTDNIAKVALSILDKHPSLYPFEPIGRDGETVEIISGSQEKRYNKIAKLLLESLTKHQAVAIIGRTVSDCEKIKAYLVNELPNVTLLIEDDRLTGNVIVIPVSMVGGLEFDAVIIADHEQYHIEEKFEAQQLYLAVTRAVHKLILA